MYYLYEYTSGQNYLFGETNNLISNLKKSPTRANRPAEYRHKLDAIQKCARDLSHALNREWLDGATLVPVPPSKARGTPEYDDRISQICRAIPASPIDVRELVVQRTSMDAAHVSGNRPSVEELLAAYEIDEALTSPAPLRIAIVDDVVTAGTHYRAVHTLLSGRFPGIPVIGVFIARRALSQDQRSPFAAIDP
ncbi:MAG: hypothetical protein AB7T40_04385 [Alphaproteobacteria bacterium]